MKKKLKSMVKIVILFFILTGILFAGDVQDDLTDTSLQNTYGIKDGGVISASNLRTLFMKLASGAWSSNGSSIYYDKGNVGIGTDNPESTLHVRNASGNCEIKFQYGVGNRGLLGAYANKVSLFLLGSEISDGNDGILHIKSGGDNIVFDGNDNVGIGTISPTEKLSIVGSMIQDDVTTMRFLRLGLDSNAGYGLSLGYGYFTSPYSFASVLQSLDNNIGTNLLLNPSGGNVGIGTTDPKTKLDVNGTLYLRKNDNGNEGGEIQFQGSGSNPGWSQDIYDNMMRFWVHGNDSGDNLVLYQNGNVGIGSSNNIPDEKLVVYGNIKATGTITPSDFRYKKNINTLENALEKVLSLHGVSFEWKTEEYQDKHFSKGKNMGFIAQEAEKVVPEVVQTGKDGYKSMAYANLTALLVEAVKELKSRNDDKIKEMEIRMTSLEKQNEALKIQNEELIKRLNAYETKMEKIDTLLMKK